MQAYILTKTFTQMFLALYLEEPQSGNNPKVQHLGNRTGIEGGHQYNGILLSNRKEWIIHPTDTMNESRAEWER